jgi:hypothetical protein
LVPSAADVIRVFCSLCREHRDFGSYDKLCSAFTVVELREMLPEECRSHKSYSPEADKDKRWFIDGPGDYFFCGAKEADARARMLVYLVFNNNLIPT